MCSLLLPIVERSGDRVPNGYLIILINPSPLPFLRYYHDVAQLQNMKTLMIHSRLHPALLQALSPHPPCIFSTQRLPDSYQIPKGARTRANWN
jgi:hypothetical protein